MTFPHLAFVIVINVIWGSMFIVGTLGLEEFPPIFFSALRFVLLSVLLIGYVAVPRRLILPLLWIGLVIGVGMYLTLYLSLALAENTASVALVSKLEVPFAIILGVVILGEKIGIKRIAGVAIAMVGAIVIGFDPSAADDLPALFWMTASGALFALSMVMIRRLGESVSALTVTAWISIVGAPVFFAVSMIFETDHMTILQEATWHGWSALAYTVLFGSIIAHSGYYYLLQHYPVGMIAPFSLLSPVFAVIGGVLFLDDALTPGLIAGGLLVLAGVAWINYRTGKVKQY